MKLKAFFFEILPISVFFIISQYFSIILAALYASALSILVLICFYFVEKRVAQFQIFSIFMSGAFSLIAFYLNEEVFVKIQPTIFNGLFSIVLLVGLLHGKAMMKQFFETQFSLNEKTWKLLSFRWGMFFCFLAVVNEIAWRNLSTENWVNIKVFILAPLVGLFMLAQLPLTIKGTVKKRSVNKSSISLKR